MRGRPTQIVIDGEHFDSMSFAIASAKHRGFTGSKETFFARVKRGATTWAEILAPVGKQGINSNPGRAAFRAREKAQMAQMCAELDARKAALQERA